MVTGTAALHKRFQKVPLAVRDEMKRILSEEATKLVSEMNSVKPIPAITIKWTWGDAPDGALSIGKIKGKKYGKLTVTLYATVKSADFPGGHAAMAAWFEFGTAARFHKSGKYVGEIAPSGYFYPIFRANKSRILARLRRGVNRVMKKA